MAIGFRTSGMFGKRPSAALPLPNGIPIGVEAMQQPAKPKFFGQGGIGRQIAGTIGDALLTFGGGDPVYAPMMMQREDAKIRQQMAEQKRMQEREDKQWEWQNKPKDEPNPTEFERILAASGLPPEQQIQLMQDYARNRANPVQGVPYTDAQGNSGIQFIRPGQMQGGQQQGLIPIGGTLPPKGGSGGNVTGGFR